MAKFETFGRQPGGDFKQLFIEGRPEQPVTFVRAANVTSLPPALDVLPGERRRPYVRFAVREMTRQPKIEEPEVIPHGSAEVQNTPIAWETEIPNILGVKESAVVQDNPIALEAETSLVGEIEESVEVHTEQTRDEEMQEEVTKQLGWEERKSGLVIVSGNALEDPLFIRQTLRMDGFQKLWKLVDDGERSLDGFDSTQWMDSSLPQPSRTQLLHLRYSLSSFYRDELSLEANPKTTADAFMRNRLPQADTVVSAVEELVREFPLNDLAAIYREAEKIFQLHGKREPDPEAQKFVNKPNEEKRKLQEAEDKKKQQKKNEEESKRIVENLNKQEAVKEPRPIHDPLWDEPSPEAAEFFRGLMKIPF